MRKPCNPRRRKPGESEAQYRQRCGPRPLGQIKMGEKKNPRIPRKKDNQEVQRNIRIYIQMRTQREL